MNLNVPISDRSSRKHGCMVSHFPTTFLTLGNAFSNLVTLRSACYNAGLVLYLGNTDNIMWDAATRRL